MDWTWYLLFPIWLVIYTGFQIWAIEIAAVMIAVGYFLERRARKRKAAQRLMLDYVLEEYSVTEGLRYQSDPDTWVYPEVRHKVESRSDFIDQMNEDRKKLIDEFQAEQE